MRRPFQRSGCAPSFPDPVKAPLGAPRHRSSLSPCRTTKGVPPSCTPAGIGPHQPVDRAGYVRGSCTPTSSGPRAPGVQGSSLSHSQPARLRSPRTVSPSGSRNRTDRGKWIPAPIWRDRGRLFRPGQFSTRNVPFTTRSAGNALSCPRFTRVRSRSTTRPLGSFSRRGQFSSDSVPMTRRFAGRASSSKGSPVPIVTSPFTSLISGSASRA
mmetsp:Transcript_7835/g.13834  ORF Transcript_7835/g.13834 Transcript_7835/m.13834 type:complete len:212 (-) Transcript_7835:27-662(-)